MDSGIITPWWLFFVLGAFSGYTLQVLVRFTPCGLFAAIPGAVKKQLLTSPVHAWAHKFVNVQAQESKHLAKILESTHFRLPQKKFYACILPQLTHLSDQIDENIPFTDSNSKGDFE